jgi:hypothetical protein
MSYDTLALIHSLAAYIWLGSLFGSLVFSTRIGLPAAVILLISGIWMVAAFNLGSGMWINIGFILWLVAAVVGSALMHPTARKMRNATTDSESIALAKRIIWIGAGEIIAIAIAIWVMGVKPGS